MAIQHWLHEVGKSHTDALGIGIVTTAADKVTSDWETAVKQALKLWADESDINPFEQTLGFENIRVFTNPYAWKSHCNNGIACASVSGGEKQGGDRECSINISNRYDSLSWKYKRMAMLHELGHCYSLAHNDQFMENPDDGEADEEAEVSRAELMHASGCPDENNECKVTDQAKSVINTAY